MNNVILIILVLIILFYYSDEISTFVSRRKVCNNIDSRCYEIVSKYGDPQNASALLAHLNNFGISIMRHLREKYIFDDVSNLQAREVSMFLLSNYNPDTIIENAPINDVNTSYVDDKGKVFAVCLREKSSGQHKFHDKHILEFVVMHEMAHMATYSFGHELSFWTNFKFIMEEAEKASLHKPTDYGQYPEVYCSLKIDYSPYYDHTLQSFST